MCPEQEIFFFFNRMQMRSGTQLHGNKAEAIRLNLEQFPQNDQTTTIPFPHFFFCPLIHPGPSLLYNVSSSGHSKRNHKTHHLSHWRCLYSHCVFSTFLNWLVTRPADLTRSTCSKKKCFSSVSTKNFLLCEIQILDCLCGTSHFIIRPCG